DEGEGGEAGQDDRGERQREAGHAGPPAGVSGAGVRIGPAAGGVPVRQSFARRSLACAKTMAPDSPSGPRHFPWRMTNCPLVNFASSARALDPNSNNSGVELLSMERT